MMPSYSLSLPVKRRRTNRGATSNSADCQNWRERYRAEVALFKQRAPATLYEFMKSGLLHDTVASD